MRTPSNRPYVVPSAYTRNPPNGISIGSSISARLNGATSTYKQIVAMSVAIGHIDVPAD